MTLGELLALLGRAWPRLALYPGGLAGLAGALLWIWLRGGRRPLGPLRPADGRAASLLALAAPWLGLALLPLPLAAPVGRSVDAAFALALLELPALLCAAGEARAGRPARLAALLNGYPPLVAAALLLAAPAGSLDVQLLGQAPGPSAPLAQAAAHWAGAACWLAALAPLLWLGPFACPDPPDPTLRLALGARAAGLVALAALPWAGLLREDQLWLLPLPLAGAAAALWLLHLAGRGRDPLPWARALLWLACCGAAGLLAVAAQSLADRLR